MNLYNYSLLIKCWKKKISTLFYHYFSSLLPLEKRICVMTSLLCVWNQFLKYVESSMTNFVLVMRASRGLISIQYTRWVGRNGTLEATRGAPVPATVMSGRLLKSEMMRTILGRNLCRVSSICCIRKFETATNTLVVQLLNWQKTPFYMQCHQKICRDILCILWIYCQPHTEKNLSEIDSNPYQATCWYPSKLW